MIDRVLETLPAGSSLCRNHDTIAPLQVLAITEMDMPYMGASTNDCLMT